NGTLKLRPLSPDHPLNDPTPTWVRALTTAMLALMRRMASVAKQEAARSASVSGWYGVTVFVKADGFLLWDKDGVPVITPAPCDVMAIDPSNNAILFAQPNQLVKRADAAKLAATSESTLKRAEANGELRATKVGERDTSYYMADLNAWMMRD